MLKEAIEKVGEDPTKVAKYLYSIDFYGASGRIRLDEFGDGIREYKLKIIKNGIPVSYE
jgi:ABC-type branched-subunit amino acid transport system substrate-binding protein